MKKNRGFTLMEVMIVIVVVGILAAIAIPAYTAQVRKSRRAEAQAVLISIGARQQQMLLDTRGYVATVADLSVSVPDSVSLYYTLALTADNTTVPTFTATATPVTASRQNDDSCGAMSLDQTGKRMPSSCW